jgi:hypothetical protein
MDWFWALVYVYWYLVCLLYIELADDEIEFSYLNRTRQLANAIVCRSKSFSFFTTIDKWVQRKWWALDGDVTEKLEKSIGRDLSENFSIQQV